MHLRNFGLGVFSVRGHDTAGFRTTANTYRIFGIFLRHECSLMLGMIHDLTLLRSMKGVAENLKLNRDGGFFVVVMNAL